MRMALVICPLVLSPRPLSVACPFCGAVALAEPAPVQSSRLRLDRAALVFGAMAVSVGAAACSRETVAQPYGAPPQPPSEDAGASAVVALYGAPPATAIAAPYGAPPTPIPDPVLDAGLKKAPK